MKGSDKSTAGCVDMKGDIEPSFLFEVVKRHRHSLHWLVLQGVSNAERGHDSNRVFVATLDDLLWSHQQTLASQGISRSSTSK